MRNQYGQERYLDSFLKVLAIMVIDVVCVVVLKSL
jgi:hypothetical protein